MSALSSKSKSISDLEPKAVSELLLDSANYRFSPEDETGTQEALLSLLEDNFDLLPIGKSMADNGYFIVEPLIGIPSPNGNIIIVEGNRRLATLKLLNDPEARRHSKNKETWEGLSETAKKNGYDFKRVPVVIYQDRKKLNSILGFRHITGTKKWGPLSKARFINDLIQSKGKKADFINISREVGSRSDTVRNNYTAYRLFLQARDEFRIDTELLEKSFGVWYTALNNTNIREYIGLKREKSIGRLKSPLTKKYTKELRDVIGYIHGENDAKAVISDSRQLSRLGDVLTSKDGLSALQKTRDLDIAWRASGGEERTLLINLETASFHLDEALKSAHRHQDSPNVVALIKKCEGTIIRLIQSLKEPAQSLLAEH